MARTSYAKAMELAASKRAKYEERLEKARRTGDRFAINSAQRAIDRITQYEQQLFDSQEEQKVAKGITPQPAMAFGGPVGSPFDTNPGLTPQERYQQALANTARQMLVNDGVTAFKQPDAYTNDQVLAAARQKGLLDLAKSNTKQILANPEMQTTGTYGYGGKTKMDNGGLLNLASKTANPQGAQLINPFINNPGPGFDPKLPFSQTGTGKFLQQAGQLAPYALQFATDMYAMNQLKNIQAPVDMPMAQTPILNTDVDTSATRAQMLDNMATFNAGVDSSMSNSAAVQNVKLANLAQTNRGLAELGQQEANQEMALRNQQIGLSTDTINRNLMTDAANRGQLVDFENAMLNARLGLVQGMGVKAAQVGSEFAQRRLDQQRLETLAKQYDAGLLSRNFSDLGIGGNPYTDEATRTMMVNALKDPAMKDQMMQRLENNPDLLQYLMQFVNQ